VDLAFNGEHPFSFKPFQNFQESLATFLKAQKYCGCSGYLKHFLEGHEEYI
jgi:hypothetical protein